MCGYQIHVPGKRKSDEVPEPILINLFGCNWTNSAVGAGDWSTKIIGPLLKLSFQNRRNMEQTQVYKQTESLNLSMFNQNQFKTRF